MHVDECLFSNFHRLLTFYTLCSVTIIVMAISQKIWSGRVERPAGSQSEPTDMTSPYDGLVLINQSPLRTMVPSP